MSKKTVSFHDNPPDPSDVNKYKEALRKAKQSNKDRPGDLKNTPRFDQTSSWEQTQEEPSNNFLSPDTKQGLSALARAAKQEEKQARPKPTSSPASKLGQISHTPQGTVVEEEPPEEVAKPTTPEDKLRNIIESRIEAIDIGAYLMSGEVRQAVPIIPDKLEVTYKTVSDLEESFVDNQISSESKDISNRQFLRKMNELALVIHIYSVNGNKWPTLVNGDGTINEQSVDSRLRHIKKLSSPIFSLLTQNLAWFTDRVTEALTSSALGNG